VSTNPLLGPGHRFPEGLLVFAPLAGVLVGWAWNQYGLAGAFGALHVIALVEVLRKRILRYVGRRDLLAHAEHIASPPGSPRYRGAATASSRTAPAASRDSLTIWQPHSIRFKR
jgi:hypothetical protein